MVYSGSVGLIVTHPIDTIRVSTIAIMLYYNSIAVTMHCSESTCIGPNANTCSRAPVHHSHIPLQENFEKRESEPSYNHKAKLYTITL